MSMRLLGAVMLSVVVAFGSAQAAKPGGEEALKSLREGNERFVSGKVMHPNTGHDRRQLAARSNQGDYATATIVSCSDSRVPVEYLFDSGIMDVFVIRIAGNVCDTDEIGSVEYGVRHVKTPLLVVLGHSQCGAVTAVAQSVKGEGHALEKNIPPLVDNIIPAVERVSRVFPQATLEDLVRRSIEENVWQGIESLFTRSAGVRELARSGSLKVMGAVYELETGRVRWLPSDKIDEILKKAEMDPMRETEVMAGGGHEKPGGKDKPADAKPGLHGKGEERATTEIAPGHH